MERLPTLTRRHLIARYGKLVAPPADAGKARRGRPAGRYDKAERKGAAA